LAVLGADLNIKAKQKRRSGLRRLCHHPTEIKATLKTAREFFKTKDLVRIPAASFSRTKLLLESFAKVLMTPKK